MNYLPRLTLNRDPPDLHLPSGLDYRREPLCPAEVVFLNHDVILLLGCITSPVVTPGL
jgi:hypothetical protein